MMATSTSSLRSQLDGLSLDTTPEKPRATNSPNTRALPSTKSLLLKSLAAENLRPTPPPDPQDFYIENGIDEDHPEPSLLATSVGTDHDGRLIPSSSTISLLSLNNFAAQPDAHNNGGGGHFSLGGAHAVNPAAKGAVFGLNHVPERVGSYTNLRSRNSITHLGQQRLQPYQHFSSPVVAPVGEFAAVSSPQPIPWNKTHLHMNTPDSPNLHPTSIGESPSRFWLNAQTPPAALANPLTKARPHFFGQGALGLTPIHLGNQDRQVFPHALNIDGGSNSPVLHPVLTPLEEVPMTPLYLSSEGDVSGERRTDYFFGSSEPYGAGEADDYSMD